MESQDLQNDLSQRTRPPHHGRLARNGMSSRLGEGLVVEALGRSCQGTNHHDHHLQCSEAVVSGVIMLVFLLASTGGRWRWFTRFRMGRTTGLRRVPASPRRALPGDHFGTKCERNAPALPRSQPRRGFRSQAAISGRKGMEIGCRRAGEGKERSG